MTHMQTRRTRRCLRAQSAHENWESRFGPNMTPMVDIVLVILIFFMAGTTFLGQEWFLRSEAFRAGPAPKKSDSMELPPVWLTIRLTVGATNSTIISGLGGNSAPPLGVQAFTEKIRDFAAGTDTSKIIVVIVPDPNVPYKDVVATHEACARAGIERVGISQ